ncbi:MAG: Nif3-like dinuclear metal center hexameric protein [Chthoniobacterales bacterium]
MQKSDSRQLTTIADHADGVLRTAEIADYDNAVNGLQVENDGCVTKIAAAVDASVKTVRLAAERGADLLVVHHGIFWPGLRPICGPFRELLKIAFEHNIAIYAAHIPLDVHSELGNNALLMRALRIENSQPFFDWKNVQLGQRAAVTLSREELTTRLHQLFGSEMKIVAAGSQNVRSVGVITGGAGSEIFEIAKLGIDTFITGEAPHWAAVAAHDLKINFFVAGHYATEVFGVRALASHLSERFGIPHEFIDCPTGF